MRIAWRVVFSVAIAGAMLAVFVMSPQKAHATTGINQELSFEGKIVNTSTGQNIADGSYNMEFKIYSGNSCVPTTGVSCTLDWTEDWLVGSSPVTLTSGTYQVNLGSVTPFASNVNWDTFPLYLSLQIGSTTTCTPAGNFQTNCGGDGEMKPYILLTSTPYSMNTNLLDGLDSTAFGQLAVNQTYTGNNTFEPATNSGTAFQIQNSVGAAVFLADTTSTAANGNQLNYLTYPGFESGSFSNASAGWAPVSPGLLVQNTTKLHTYNGLFSAQLTTTTSNGGLTTSSFVSAPPTGTYLISWYAKVSTGTMASTAFQVKSTDGASHTCSPAAGITINSSGFQRLFCSITTTGAMTALSINQTDSTGRIIYIDAVQLQSNSFNGGTITAPTPYQIGGLQLRGVIQNPVSILPNGDSTNVFQISNAAGTSTLLNADTLDNAVTIGGSTLASAVTIGADGSAAVNSTIDIGNSSAGVQTINIGSLSSTSLTTIQGGTVAGAVTIQAGSAGSVLIGTNAVAGTTTIGDDVNINTGNTQTLSLGNLSVAGTSNVSIGSTTSATGGTTTITGKTAVNITGFGASTWSTSGAALTINGGTTLTAESASGSVFTASSLGAATSNFGTAGTGDSVVGNTTGSDNLQATTYDAGTDGVLIGNGATTANPILLDLDNATLQGAETAGDCSTTINSGAIYYSASTASSSTTTNEVRGCINGKWTDVVTGDQLGIMLFGVEEGSGTTVGDISGVTGFTKSPCKVTWASTTSVTVAPCTAYSGGRKVAITAAVTVTTAGTGGSTTFQHICLSGTNGAPTATAANTSETAAVPTFTAATPILCLATVKLGTTPSITDIYDTRVFVTSTKEYISSSTAAAPGMIEVINTTAANSTKTVAVAATAEVRGVVAVGNTTGSTTTINAILVVGGPAFVKATGTLTIGQAAETSATAGYAESIASAAGYKDLGQILDNGSTAACNAATNCQFSVLVDVSPH